MSLFDAPPGTLMSPIAVHADTSLGSVVIRRLYEASAGAAVLTQAPRIGASARARLTERRRRLDGITLRSGPEISCSPKRLPRWAPPLHRDVPVCRITVGSQIILKAPPHFRGLALCAARRSASCNPFTTVHILPAVC